MNTLIITEKYSVARDYVIPACGGVDERNVKFSSKGAVGYVKCCNGFYVTWAMGHLLGTDYEKSGSNIWNLDKLPFYTEVNSMVFEPYPHSKSQVKVIKDLLTKMNITTVINACDCEREGELIGREILDYLGYKGEIKRIWSNDSLTVSTMKKMIADVRPSQEFDKLHYSARLRQFSDFFIGLNLTEIATSAARKILKDKTVYTLGRIQTPLLCAIAKREEEINNFVASKTYRLVKNIKGDSTQTQPAAQFSFDLLLNNDEELSVLSEQECASLLQSPYLEEYHKNHKFVGRPQQIADKYSAPLFSLTTLQKHMNRVKGWTASKTADIADELYKLGVATYPRTAGQHLSEDFSVKAKFVKIMTNILQDHLQSSMTDQEIKDAVMKCGKRVFNLEALKKTDAAHDAYIVNEDYSAKYSSLTADQKALGDEVMKRMVRVVLSPVQVLVDTIDYTATGTGLKVKNTDIHTISGSFTYTHPIQGSGYLSIFPHEASNFTENFDFLPPLTANVDPNFVSREVVTKAPPAFTVIGVLDYLERNNLGTAATRTGFLDTLLDKGYVFMQGKAIKVTDKGNLIYSIFKDTRFSSEEATAKMEEDMRNTVEGIIQESVYTANLFQELTQYKDCICKGFENTTPIQVQQAQEDNIFANISCPKCGAFFTSTFNAYQGIKCSCGFSFPAKMKGVTFTATQVANLLVSKKLPVKGMTSKNGKKFNCTLSLDKNGDLEFLFD